ncbi:MAG: (2Fe-2S) ferredoxin domain-containing protein [Nostocales cyanobacterium]|nr:MAG: (2Fe-2S) ferredoxin domain-containing protein [Nostocales cyanobacterium]TAF12668.1 MAG: (2Fe-2S) ferredoxin domain-containing protein [Nostocales cyanobacterium]
MSMYPSVEVSEFCLEGRFLDFVIKDGYKLKGLLLSTADGEHYIKLAKHLRAAFDLRLPRGTWLQVVGTKKHHYKKDQVTLKAERIMAATSQLMVNTAPPQQPPTARKQDQQTKQTILMCQKSDCMKRGGKALCQVLESELSNRGLQDTVNIKGTGCMKNCKAGPNIVMPDKTRYTKVNPSQVAILVDKHFGEDVEIELPDLVKV